MLQDVVYARLTVSHSPRWHACDREEKSLRVNEHFTGQTNEVRIIILKDNNKEQ